MVANNPDGLRWLAFSRNSPSRQKQYPPSDSGGLFSMWDGWKHGFFANPLHRFASRIDSPTTVQHNKDEYKCIHGGLLVASINLQSLRGAMQKKWRHSEQGLVLSGRSGAYATDMPDDIFATRSKKNLVCWQLSARSLAA